jgi:hypothetical protein
VSDSIKVLHAALDEDGDEIILRGSIDPNSLRHLKVADYQREILPLSTIAALAEAFEKGSVPDIDLGMRGERYIDRGGVIYLQDDVYIVDGLQRVTAAMHLLNKQTGKTPRLGATIHFGTTEVWERERFRILNADRSKLSPNVLLRNMRHDFPVVDLLYKLCADKSFVLHDRVSWAQRMRRQDLISAVTLVKIVSSMHAHIGPGRYNRIEQLVPALQKMMDKVGPNIFRDNVRTFFEVVDQCWGIKRVAFKEGASYMRLTFLWCLAMIFSQHQNFWRGDRLFVEAPLIRKLSLFPVSDPQVIGLSSSGGKARDMLLYLMVKHLDSGKRTKKLRSRDGAVSLVAPEEMDDEMETA